MRAFFISSASSSEALLSAILASRLLRIVFLVIIASRVWVIVADGAPLLPGVL